MPRQTNPGPARWERARLNAEKKPNSAAAELYRGRQALADQIIADDNTRDLHRGAWQIMNHNWGYGESGQWQRKPDGRKAALCSLRCAVLQTTLNRSSLDPQTVVDSLRGVPIYNQWGADWKPGIIPLDLTDLTRTSRCFVCSTKLESSGRPHRTVTRTVEVVKPCELEHVERRWFVCTEGGATFGRVEDARLVELTEREWEILAVYSTPALREAYALEHGKAVTV